MAITLNTDSGVFGVSDVAGGLRIVECRIATYSNVYLTGGETINLSTYFSGSPTVICSTRGAYVPRHDGGTAAAGKIIAMASGDANGGPLIQVTNATDLSAQTFSFVALGTPV